MSRAHLVPGLCLLALLFPSVAGAQLAPTATDPLTITVSPAYPRPYDTVTLSVSSNLLDLVAGTVTIKANGTVIEKGLRSVQYKVGPAGSVVTISASAETNEGVFQDQISINPADVALVVEPASTVPPLYEGAALVPSEGRLRIIAVADLRQNGVRIPESQIVYTWKLGNQFLQDESGIGRNVLVATAPARYRDAQISVTASTQSKNTNAQASVIISPIDPLVRIYQNDPLQGVILERALFGTFTLNGEEAAFRIAPYFFKQDPSLSWTLNGAGSGVSKDLTVRSSGGAGSAVIGANASTESAQASAGLSVRFGSTGVGIFGL